MSSLSVLGMNATGGLAVLVGGLIISKSMNLGLEWILGPALFIFVIAGGIALVLKAR